MNSSCFSLTDLHCHILPGLDDGPADLVESLGLIRDFAAQGISKAVCTPHFTRRLHQDEDNAMAYIEARDLALASLQDELDLLDIGVSLIPGLEIELGTDLLDLLDQYDTRRFCLGSSNLILVETTRIYPGILDQLNDQLYEMQAMGLQPVMAHVERSLSRLDGAFERLYAWVDEGCLLLQVNADSVIDLDRRVDLPFQEGYRRRRFLKTLLDQNLVSFVASDAHNARYRPARLAAAYRTLEKLYSLETAQKLLAYNQALYI